MRRLLAKTLLVFGWPTLLSACDLPEITPNVCGNGVRDPLEACDTFAVLEAPGQPADRAWDERDTAAKCGEPSSEAACRYVWDESDPDTRYVCPAACVPGVDGVCRKPTGAFEPNDFVLDIAGNELSSGDFDGDGRDELVVSTTLSSQATIAYFDQTAEELRREFVSLDQFAPHVTELTGEGPTQEDPSARPREDLVVSRLNGVTLLTGEPQGPLTPEPFSPFKLPPGAVAASLPAGILAEVEQFAGPGLAPYLSSWDVPGYITQEDGDIVITVFLGLTEAPVVRVPDFDEYVLTRMEWDPTSLGESGATVDEFVFAYRDGGGSHLHVVTPKMPSASNPLSFEVDLPGDLASLPFAGAPQPLPLDDGTEALVVPFAYPAGDAQLLLLAVVHPGDVPDAEPRVDVYPTFFPVEPNGPTVLDVASFTGAGVPHMVLTTTNLLVLAAEPDCDTLTSLCCEAENCYVSRGENGQSVWTDGAFVSPLQAVAAGGAPGLDVITLVSATDPLATPARVPTSRPVTDIRVGDFDGDGLNDVLAIERSTPEPVCGIEEDVVVFWGNLLGPPSPPQRVTSIEAPSQLAVGSLLALSSIDVIDDFGIASDCPISEDRPERPAGIFTGAAARRFNSTFPIVGFETLHGSTVTANVAGDAALDVVALGLELPVDEDDPVVFEIGHATGMGDGQLDTSTEFDLATALVSGDASGGVEELRFAFGAALLGRLVRLPGAGEQDTVGLFYPLLAGTDTTGTLSGALRTFQFGDEDVAVSDAVAPDVSFEFERPSADRLDEEAAFIFQAISFVGTTAFTTDANIEGQTDDVVGLLTVGLSTEDPASQLVAFLAGSDPVVLELESGEPILAVAPAAGLYSAQNPPAHSLVVATGSAVYLCSVADSALVCDAPPEGADPRLVEDDRIFGVAVGDFDGDGAGDLAVASAVGVRILRQITNDQTCD